eukprot:UN17990
MRSMKVVKNITDKSDSESETNVDQLCVDPDALFSGAGLDKLRQHAPTDDSGTTSGATSLIPDLAKEIVVLRKFNRQIPIKLGALIVILKMVVVPIILILALESVKFYFKDNKLLYLILYNR